MATPTEDHLASELAVALAERDQADEMVMALEAKVKAQSEWIDELRAKLREWDELEKWRQAHWEVLKTELHTLREENEVLRAKLSSTPQ
jgi:chromosome segregation ATPase